MGKLNYDWSNAFSDSFETEEEVIEFIFERLDTSDFQDSYINMGMGNPTENFKITVEDKRENLYNFMIYLCERGGK